MVKFNGQQWTHNPLSLTNFHNASQAASTVGLSAEKAKGKKGTKSVVTLHQAHKSHNKAPRKAGSTSKLQVSRVVLKRGINRIGKVVKGLSNINNRVRVAALRRLRRLHVATRPIVKGGAAKKEEKK